MKHKTAVIKTCDPKDIDKSKSRRDQRFCLYTKDESRLLGRHSTEEAAQEQEAAIHARQGSTNMCNKPIEVPEFTAKSTEVGPEEPIRFKGATYKVFAEKLSDKLLKRRHISEEEDDQEVVIPLKEDEPEEGERAAALEVEAMPKPKHLDRMIERWLRELPRDAAGHRSVTLYPVVAMDASPQEWMEAAETEGMYIPEMQRDAPYIQEWLREQLNDKFAVELDDDSKFGQVGSYVYAEENGYWVLLFETPAIEDVLQVVGSTVAEVEEPVEARAPAMQLTQQIGQQPQEKGERKEEPPAVDSKVKKFFQWLGQKAKEASTRNAWSRIAAAHRVIDRRVASRSCDRDASNVIQLPTDCVAQAIGVAYSTTDTTTFEKKGDTWFVQNVDTKGVIDDNLVEMLGSYCEMQKMASTTQRKAELEYYVIANENAIWGLGHSCEDAQADTEQGVGEPITLVSFDRVLDEAMVCLPCTKELYSYVWDHGGEIRFDVEDGTAVLDEPREARTAAAPLTVDEVMKYYRDVDEAAVAQLVAQFNNGIRPGDYSAWLQEANQVLENHGVETIDVSSEAERWQLDYDEAFIAEYSNTGDSYHPTFLWDIEKEEMLWTGWADFLEGWEQEREEEIASAPSQDTLDEYVYELVLDGWAAESMGDVAELGRFDLVLFEKDDPLVVPNPDAGRDDVYTAAIVRIDEQDFVTVSYFEHEAEANLAWEDVEAAYADFYRDVERTSDKQREGATNMRRTALEGEQTELGPEVSGKFRGFNLDAIPDIVNEALNEIRSDPETFVADDERFEYWAETLLHATGRAEDYAEVLGIDLEDPEWQEAVAGGWDFDMITDIQDEIDDKIREAMDRANLPGYLTLGSHEGDGSFGLIYGISFDEADEQGIDIPSEHWQGLGLA